MGTPSQPVPACARSGVETSSTLCTSPCLCLSRATCFRERMVSSLTHACIYLVSSMLVAHTAELHARGSLTLHGFKATEVMSPVSGLTHAWIACASRSADLNHITVPVLQGGSTSWGKWPSQRPSTLPLPTTWPPWCCWPRGGC